MQRLVENILYRDDEHGGDSSVDEASSSDGNMHRRTSLAKAITLAESKSPSHRRAANALFDRLRRATMEDGAVDAEDDDGNKRDGRKGQRGHPPPRSFRLGIAGPPGVGKSTFVEALGMHVLGLGRDGGETPKSKPPFAPERLAVLCVDPSSHVSGGSVLGDKTRMTILSRHPRAYVRPSPSSGTLGGLGARTRDAVELCELAGYELVIIETVGLGQSEVELDECVDAFLLLLAPGGGDELQGSKKGIVEACDVMVVNKADGAFLDSARRTANEYKAAVSLLRRPGRRRPSEGEGGCSPTSFPPVLLASALTGDGVPEVWDAVVRHREDAMIYGELEEKRRRQNQYWMWKYLRELVLEAAHKNPAARRRAEEVERMVDDGSMAPRIAAMELWKSIGGSRGREDTE